MISLYIKHSTCINTHERKKRGTETERPRETVRDRDKEREIETETNTKKDFCGADPTSQYLENETYH